MMAQAVSVIPLLGIILDLHCVAAIELRFMPDPPTLNVTGIQRINKSDNLELSCSGRQYLSWTTPSTSRRVSTSDCSGSGFFCTTLRLTNATANETGEYRCSYKDLEVEDGKTSAAAFVFVHDYKVPFVPSEKEYEVVFIREGERVIIPCRGSVENLNVTLHTKYPKKELYPDGKDCLWDARTGFTVPSHLISYAGVVFCQTHIDSQTFKSPLYIVAVVGYKIHDLTLTPTELRLSVGERLTLSCTANTELNVGIEFNWTHSSQALTSVSGLGAPHTVSHKRKLWNSLELSNMLIVENVTVNHAGEYTCTASSGQMEKSATAFLQVYEKPFIEVKEPWMKVLEVNVGDQTSEYLIPVKYYAYPEPTVKWYKNGQQIRKDDYRIKPRNDALIIRGVTDKDTGNYTVVLTNKITKEEQTRSFQLLVNVPPHIIEKEVAVDTDVYMYGSSPTLRCTAYGIPTPANIQWQWMPLEDCPEAFQVGLSKSSARIKECTKWRDISNSTGQNPVDPIRTETDQLQKKTGSSLKIRKAEVNALYRCLATNKAGQDSRIILFHVTRGLELSVFPSTEPIEADQVVLRCKADRLIYGNLAWFRVTNVSNPERSPSVQPCHSLSLLQQPLPQAMLSGLQGTNVTLELPLPNASRQDEGLYACRVENIKTREKTCLLHHLSLRALEAARILSNLTDQKVNVSTTTTLTCDVAGTPRPTVIWTKNNRTVVKDSGVILSSFNQTLTVKRVKKEDSGLYTCTACNGLGCDTSQAFLTTEGAEEKTNVELIVPIGSVVIAMFFWLLIVFVIRGRKRPSGGDLKTGYLSMILDSEDMPMDEQCERLTYDANKWEFPRDRLKLGDPLGRGAFGQVVEAAAFGIEKATTCTTVAVKMLKEGATSSEYRALMSELKILIHIGHHLNVVNLLGACTKPGGPLMVIVEYCKHGNLSSFLKSKRGEYSPFKKRMGGQEWVPMEEDVTEGDLGLGNSAHLDICTGTAVCSRTTDTTSIVNLENSEESSDYDHLTMEDLISYSFQVAKGMEFLSSRKCIHRDLAARNILLSENNVVKICDFGLARDVYKDPDYVRKGDARLPLKWMAPETIFDRVYTTQSDVWSFGVLLWEIFSLGASPYPGVCIDELFCRRLKEGTRMRAPDYATTEIYQTMLDCWLDRPTDRPTFTELVEHLGNLLQASAQQDGKDYIPLTTDEIQMSPVNPDPRSPYTGPLSGDTLEPQLHYDNAPILGMLSQQSDRCSRPLSVKTFEDIPVEHSSIMEGHTDSGMSLSPDDMKGLDHQLPRTPNLSQLLRCKSKESLASESSNQTSGYQSGYHSDDTDTPIYANEEVIMKHNMLKKSPLTKTPDKFSVEVRYSTPPV
ncbi:vascular endothelial growth factor receptor 2 isoform X3 [Lampris incognitus]|uniref:vascular endothelial growth factor receptor 2 isoform X3 n=1 Tax=Lampris incognitus TaxID=2546036 RepID=UPI0024B5E2DE|nr:vascular endothelial growth factor receptor 2 isoform X3 [Lampris incognitus]